LCKEAGDSFRSINPETGELEEPEHEFISEGELNLLKFFLNHGSEIMISMINELVNVPSNQVIDCYLDSIANMIKYFINFGLAAEDCR
jgi:hypothetical protein